MTFGNQFIPNFAVITQMQLKHLFALYPGINSGHHRALTQRNKILGADCQS
jgi:hypothetical protein